jgi:drug/metabolite transporter (DMT)-like permease
MIETWIPITILAAFSQNLRSAYQRKLQFNVTSIISTYTRFLFGLPFVFIYFLVIYNFSNSAFHITNYNLIFFIYCFIGGVSQIIATFLLLRMFINNNFSVATAYSKTEPIQAAVFAFILFNESISLNGVIGIVIGLIGIITISLKKVELSYAFMNLSVFKGLLSAALFGLSAVLFRAASHNLNSVDYILSSSFTLLIALIIQTIILTIYIFYKDIKQFSMITSFLKDSFIVGFFGALASICWFYAMSIQNVAYVRALGQIELIFSLLISFLFFKEKIFLNQVIGIFIIFISLIIIMLLR